MGQPRRIRKTYARPLKRWDSVRIESEAKLTQKYGLKNKREIWKAQNRLRIFRRSARQILSLPKEEAGKRKDELVHKLTSLGLLKEGATLNDVLGLTVEDILNRRLQTIVYRRGIALTPKQARQMIVHGKVLVAGARNTSPGTLTPKKFEDKITATMKIEKTQPQKVVKPKAEGLGKVPEKVEEPQGVDQ